MYRGKHCPVSKNYLASLQQIIYELDELGVEVVAVSGDGRERAEAFVSFSLLKHAEHPLTLATYHRKISPRHETTIYATPAGHLHLLAGRPNARVLTVLSFGLLTLTFSCAA